MFECVITPDLYLKSSLPDASQLKYFDWLGAEIDSAIREAEERGMSDYDLDHIPHWQELKARLDEFIQTVFTPGEIAEMENHPVYDIYRQVEAIKAEYKANGWGDYTSDLEYKALAEQISELTEDL